MSSASSGDLTEDLRKLFAEITEIKDIPTEKSLKDLGVDSMMGLEIVMAIEKKYKIKIEESESGQVTTLAKATKLVASKLAEQSLNSTV